MSEEFFSQKQLDRGVGMVFHPLCGIELSRLSYAFDRRQFFTTLHFGGWSMEGRLVWFDRVSGGGSCRAGDPFPPHWKFHPLTGKPLVQRRRTMVDQIAIYTSEQIDAGQFGAEFHSVTGERLSGLHYDEVRRQFYSTDHWPESGLGWGVTVNLEQKRRYRPRIGDGRDRATGELYHSHWRFDPFSGKPLEQGNGKGLWEQE